jgi:hypothetical protein
LPQDCTTCTYAAWHGDKGRCNAPVDDAPYPAWMRNVWNTAALERSNPYPDCTAHEPVS